MAERKPIRPVVRFEIFKRDSFTCQYCGRIPPSVTLEIDHIIPVSEGGVTDPSNLLTACFDCNRGKGSRPLGEAAPRVEIPDLEEKRERAQQLKLYNDFLLEQRKEKALTIERLGAHWWTAVQCQPGYVFGPAPAASVGRFLEHLTEAEILQAMDIVVSRMPMRYEGTQWKYFCGICWKRIREREGSR